jgi:hypothetical protein
MVIKPPKGNFLLCINAVPHLGLNMKGGLQDNMIGSAQIKNMKMWSLISFLAWVYQSTVLGSVRDPGSSVFYISGSMIRFYLDTRSQTIFLRA